MSDLSTREKKKLEAYFEMGGGYYLDFSNNSLEAFIAETLDIELYSEKYNQGSGSKANRVRAIWDLEPNHVVSKLIKETIENDDDERLTNPHMNKRDAELKSHCLQIAQRLESGNSQKLGGFQPQQQQSGFQPPKQHGGFQPPKQQGGFAATATTGWVSAAETTGWISAAATTRWVSAAETTWWISAAATTSK
jgi:hypothetical protein